MEKEVHHYHDNGPREDGSNMAMGLVLGIIVVILIIIGLIFFFGPNRGEEINEDDNNDTNINIEIPNPLDDGGAVDDGDNSNSGSEDSL